MEFAELPTFAVHAVLSYLPFHERFRLRRVSTEWRYAVERALLRLPVSTFNPYGEVFLTLPWAKTSRETELHRILALKHILSLCGPAIQTLRLRRIIDATPLSKKEFYTLTTEMFQQFAHCTGLKRLEIEGECILEVKGPEFGFVLGHFESLECIVLSGFFKSQLMYRINHLRLPKLREVAIAGTASSGLRPGVKSPIESVRLCSKVSNKFLTNLRDYGSRLRNFELQVRFDNNSTQMHLAQTLGSLLINMVHLKHLKISFSDQSAFARVRGMKTLNASLAMHLPLLKELITLQLVHDYSTLYSSCGNAPKNISEVCIPGDLAMLSAIGELPHLQALCLGNMEQGIFRDAPYEGCGKVGFPALRRLGLVGWPYDTPAAIAYFRPVANRIEQLSLEDSELGPFQPAELLASWTYLDHLNLKGARLLTGPHQVGQEERHTNEHCRNMACSARRKPLSTANIEDLLNQWRACVEGKRVLMLALDSDTYDGLMRAWDSLAFVGLYLRPITNKFRGRSRLHVVCVGY